MINKYSENELSGTKENVSFNIIESTLMPRTCIISLSSENSDEDFKEVLENNVEAHRIMLGRLIQYN